MNCRVASSLLVFVSAFEHDRKFPARCDRLVVRDSFSDCEPQKLLVPFRQFTGNDHVPIAQIRLHKITEQLLNTMRRLVKDDSTALQRDLFNEFSSLAPSGGNKAFIDKSSRIEPGRRDGRNESRWSG